jgi:hypothetical protein
MPDYRAAFPTHIWDILADKRAQDLEPVVQLGLADAAARQALVAGLQAKEEGLRYNCYKVLLKVAERDPALLCADWDSFVSMLASENSYHRMVGVTFIARLVPADTEQRFERIHEAYFAHLDDDSVIVARYVAQNAGRIARARPELAAWIVERLLGIVRTYHRAERRDLLAADVITSCAELLDLAPDKGRILAFVREQAQSKSPKTRQAAKELLRKQAAAAARSQQ